MAADGQKGGEEATTKAKARARAETAVEHWAEPPLTKRARSPRPRPSPKPSLALTHQSQGEENPAALREAVLKTNKEIVKDLRLRGFCKDFREGSCTRDIIGRNPVRCKIGAHVSSEAYKKTREKQKVDVKSAKAKRNRSQSAPPGRE